MYKAIPVLLGDILVGRPSHVPFVKPRKFLTFVCMLVRIFSGGKKKFCRRLEEEDSIL
jgi:hypothetical protein